MTSFVALQRSDLQHISAIRGLRRFAVRRVALLTAMFAALLGTGIHLEFLAGSNWNAGEIILLFHIALGLVFTGLLLSWICAHVLEGLPKSQRPAFTGLSWVLLATYLVVVATGVMMIIPSAAFLVGQIWFWRFETTHLLTMLHLWGAIAAAAGLVGHLYFRYWRRPVVAKRGSS